MQAREGEQENPSVRLMSAGSYRPTFLRTALAARLACARVSQAAHERRGGEDVSVQGTGWPNLRA